MQVRAFNRLTRSLDSKMAGMACVLIAVVNKSIVSLLHSSLNGDKALYLLFARSFLETGKLAEPIRLMENGSSGYYFEPAVHSPLYSLLAAPLLWLTNSFFVTQAILSVLGWILFFTALYALARLVLRQQWVVGLFILCTGFFLYPHEMATGPKDTLATGFTLWSIVLIHRFITTKPRLVITLLLAVSLCCIAMMKLLYVPLAVVLLFLLFAYLLLEQKKSHVGQALVLLGFLVLAGVLVHYAVFKPVYELAAQNTVSLPRNGAQFVRGYFPGNLLLTYPFISSSIINTLLVSVQLERLTSFTYSEIMQAFFYLDTVLFVVLIMVSLWYSRQIIANRVLFCMTGVSLAMIGLLLFLSATEKGLTYKSSTGMWTYVADARSYLVPMITVQLVFFLFVFKANRLRLLRYVVLVLFLLQCFHGLYFSAKQTITASALPEGGSDTEMTISRLLRKEDSTGKRPILITSDIALRRYVTVQGLPVYSFSSLEADLGWMKKGSSFLVATHAVDSAYLQKFPANSLVPLDTIPPFLMHRYDVK